MVSASTYQWPAVRSFHYKVLRSIELGLVKWGDSFDHHKEPFFIPSAMLAETGNKTTKTPIGGSTNSKFLAAKFVTSGHGMTTAPPRIAQSYMCAWCVNAPTTKLSVVPNASSPFLLAARNKLLGPDYPPTPSIYSPTLPLFPIRRTIPTPPFHPLNFLGIPRPRILPYNHHAPPVFCR